MRAGDTLEALDALGAGRPHGSPGGPAGPAGPMVGPGGPGTGTGQQGAQQPGPGPQGVLVGAVDLHTKPSLHTDLGGKLPLCQNMRTGRSGARKKEKGGRDASRFFLQRESPSRYSSRHRPCSMISPAAFHAHVAVVPGLVAHPGELRLPAGVPEDKPVLLAVGQKPLLFGGSAPGSRLRSGSPRRRCPPPGPSWCSLVSGRATSRAASASALAWSYPCPSQKSTWFL